MKVLKEEKIPRELLNKYNEDEDYSEEDLKGDIQNYKEGKLKLEAMNNVPKSNTVETEVELVMAKAKEDSDKNAQEAEKQGAIPADKAIKQEPFTGHKKKDYPKKPEEPKATLDESLFEDIHDRGLAADREGIFEFPNGEYFYVDEKDGVLYAGPAVNTGIIHEFEVEYDEDATLEENLEALYNKMVEERPELLDEVNESLNEGAWSQSGEDTAAIEGREAGKSILIGLAKFLPVNIDDKILGDIGGAVGSIGARHLYRRRNGKGQVAKLPEPSDDVEMEVIDADESLNESDDMFIKRGLSDEDNQDYETIKNAMKKPSEKVFGGYNDTLVTIKDGKVVVSNATLNKREALKMAKRIEALADNLSEQLEKEISEELSEGVFHGTRRAVVDDGVGQVKSASDDDYEPTAQVSADKENDRYDKWTQTGELQAAIEGGLAGKAVGQAVGSVIPGKLDDVILGRVGAGIGRIGGRHVYRHHMRQQERERAKREKQDAVQEEFVLSPMDYDEFEELKNQYKGDIYKFIGAVMDKIGDDAKAEEFEDLAYKAKSTQEIYELAQEFLYKNYAESLQEQVNMIAEAINYTSCAMKQQGLSEEVGHMREEALNGDLKSVCESYLEKCNILAEQIDDDYVIEGLQYVTAGINLNEAKESDKKELEDKYLGKKIRIISMEGEPGYEGKEGVVETVDDAPQLHGTWGGLAVIPGVDKFEVIG